MLKVSSLIALTFLLTLTPDAFASMGSSLRIPASR